MIMVLYSNGYLAIENETGERDTLLLDNEQVASLRSFLEENSHYIKED